MSSPMQRIVVIGSPGAGKTTFARKLGPLLNVEPIHLDLLFWEPGWKEKPIEERVAIQHNLVRKDTWIMEGTYLDSSDARLNAADTIIFLDRPLFLCFWRVIWRRIKCHNILRPDLPQGCPEKLNWRYLLKVLVFPFRGRKLYFKKKRRIEVRQFSWEKEKKTVFYWLKSSKDIEDFFEGKAAPHKAHPISTEEQQKLAILSKMNSAAAYILHWMRENRGRIGTSLALASLSPIALWCISDNKVDSDTIQ